MLRELTNWSDLREALQARGEALYLCEDCGNVWISSASESPARCHNRDCRAWANGPKRNAVGRPTDKQLEREAKRAEK